jgi:hypothetical protein
MEEKRLQKEREKKEEEEREKQENARVQKEAEELARKQMAEIEREKERERQQRASQAAAAVAGTVDQKKQIEQARQYASSSNSSQSPPRMQKKRDDLFAIAESDSRASSPSTGQDQRQHKHRHHHHHHQHRHHDDDNNVERSQESNPIGSIAPGVVMGAKAASSAGFAMKPIAIDGLMAPPSGRNEANLGSHQGHKDTATGDRTSDNTEGHRPIWADSAVAHQVSKRGLWDSHESDSSAASPQKNSSRVSSARRGVPTDSLGRNDNWQRDGVPTASPLYTKNPGADDANTLRNNRGDIPNRGPTMQMQQPKQDAATWMSPRPQSASLTSSGAAMKAIMSPALNGSNTGAAAGSSSSSYGPRISVPPSPNEKPLEGRSVITGMDGKFNVQSGIATPRIQDEEEVFRLDKTLESERYVR